MKTQLTLTVPKPCSEKWDNFLPTANGGFCNSCGKTVTDFTHMSEDEILNFFKERPAGTCGRFRPNQLRTYSTTTMAPLHPGLRLFYSGVLSLLFVLINKSTIAHGIKSTAPTEQLHYDGSLKYDQSVPGTSEYTVRGVVTSEEDGGPLPGVNIILKGSNIGTTTDANGKFEFPQKLSEGDVLIFSFIGFETMEYTVRKESSDPIEIPLMLYYEIMGEVSIDAPYIPDSALSRLWKKVKQVF